MIKTKKLNKQFHENHMQKRKMLQDRNQGVFLEDMIQMKMRFRDNVHGGPNRTSLLPRIAP